jgi:hypothetical protein
MTPETPVAVRSNADLIAIIPFVLGYHPADSLVVAGLSGPVVDFAVCFELPPRGADPDECRAEEREIAAAVGRQGSAEFVVIGFGPGPRTTPAVLRLVETLREAGVRVSEALRVTEGRWWSYFCERLRCCPDEGNPCQPPDGVIAAEATFRGQVALPSRRHLIAQVASLEGPTRLAMGRATSRARKRFAGLITDGAGPERFAQRIRHAGRTAVRQSELRYRNGRLLDENETAWLGALLAHRAVEDYALDRIMPDDWRIRLWTDVLRRVDRVYVPAPAALLGFTAWQAGQGALARVAVDRALDVDRHHQLAGLLHQILGFGLGPHLFPRPTPRLPRQTKRLPRPTRRLPRPTQRFPRPAPRRNRAR